MSKNELTAFSAIPFSPAAIAKPKAASERGFASRLQFISTGSSKLVSAGKVKVGNYALVDGENVADLGDTVVVIPLVRLDKAVDNSDSEIIVAFQQSDPEEYDRIVAEVLEGGYDSGCMYGPVFLCYEIGTGQFVELFLNNASGRNEAERLNAFLPISKEAAAKYEVQARPPRPCVLGSKFVESKRGKKTYQYNVPTTSELKGTVNVQNPPTQEQLTKAIANFTKQAEPKEDEGRDR